MEVCEAQSILAAAVVTGDGYAVLVKDAVCGFEVALSARRERLRFLHQAQPTGRHGQQTDAHLPACDVRANTVTLVGSEFIAHDFSNSCRGGCWEGRYG